MSRAIWKLIRDPDGDAETKTFEEWGISAPSRSRTSQATDRFVFNLDLATADATPPLAFKEEISITRTIGATTVQMFRGIVAKRPLAAPGATATIQYIIAGPWWWLEQLVFEQIWYQAIDPTDPSSSIVGGYKSHVTLNQGFNGTILNTAQQIEAVIDYVNLVAGERGLTYRLQMGVAPAVEIPLDEQTDILCSDVMRKQGRWMPSASWEIDYATTPPTLNVRKRADQIVRQVTVGGADPSVDVVRLDPREDLKVEAVVLKFERTDTSNGTSWLYTVPDVFPVSSPERGFDRFVATIDLTGYSYQYEVANFKTVPWYAISGQPNATGLAWLRNKFPFLYDARVDTNSIRAFIKRIEFENGNVSDWSSLNPNNIYAFEIIEGQVPPWATPSAVDYTVHYEIAYDTRDAASRRQRTEKKPVSFRVTAIPIDTRNLPGGQGTFSRLSAYEAGDPIPTGLAQSLYEELNVLQWDGEIHITKLNIEDDYKVGEKLRIAGGAAEWAAMDATIQSIVETPDDGTIRITVGYANHLGPIDVLELLKANRTRRRWTAPGVRDTGALPAQTTNFAKKQKSDDSTSGDSILRKFLMSDYGDFGQPSEGTRHFDIDVDGKALLRIKQDRDGNGVMKDSEVELDLSKANGKKLFIREVDVCVEGEDKKALFVCSEPYDP